MFIELHLIQSFPPANLNRDDTNNPKDCEFGGVRRARISSQCLKRAMRKAPVFARATGVGPGIRTKRLIQTLRAPLTDAGKDRDDIDKVLRDFVPAFASKLDKDNERTMVLLYVSPAEIAGLASSLGENWSELVDDGKRSETVKRLSTNLTRAFKERTSAPDIALFGRMLAKNPELGLDAACQVAHAISTHRIMMEMDFYTAVDDLQPEDTAGAEMMGFTGFDSACFYRYARLDWDQLLSNLDGDAPLARATVEGFLRASIAAIPTGKQNTFAAQNPPSFMLATVRDGGEAWSLANAFEKPVRPRGDDGLVAPSVKALDAYWGQLGAVYGTQSLRAVAALGVDPEMQQLVSLTNSRVGNLQALLDVVMAALPAGEGV